MSEASASAGAREEDFDDHDAMLNALDVAIDEAKEKIESGRVYDAKNEKARQGWIRTLAYAINVRRQVVVDRDLEDLAERIEALEGNGATGGGNGAKVEA